MKEFLIQLANGIKIIPRKFEDFFDDLEKKGFVVKKNGLYTYQADYFAGSVDISRSGRAFFCMFGSLDKKDFVIERLPKNISQGSIILCKIARIKGRLRAKFIALLYGKDHYILCYLKKIKGEMLAFDFKDTRKPIRPKASKKSLLALPESCVLSIHSTTKEIKKVFGVLKDPLIDEKISLALFERKENFSNESLELAKSFGEEVDGKMYPQREDLTHLPFCTIDPDDAKDHDDAIYFDAQRSHLYVAIADVSEYVSVDSTLDNEAKERGFSVYLPHKSFPMLPRNLSENICSLKNGKTRLAFVWRLRLHKRSAEVLEACLFEALIRNHQNISYSNVDRILEGENIPIVAGVKKSICEFLPVAKKLRNKRLKKGYEFFNDELKLELDKKGDLKKVDISYPGFSHMIVEEAMLLANKQSALFLQSHLEEGGIYRVHSSPSEERARELFFDLATLGFTTHKDKDFHQNISLIQKQAKAKGMQKQIDKMIIKAQSQAQYSSANIGHFGLGFEAYSHFTSPIRRYSDLLLHRILKQILSNAKNSDKKLAYLLSNAKSSCALLNDLEKQSAKIEFDFKDRKYARWASQNIGVRLDVLVMDANYPMIASAISEIIGARIFIEDSIEELNKFDVACVEILKADIGNAKIFARALRKENV